MSHSTSVQTNHERASATRREIWVRNMDAVMRGSDFILTQINCAHSHMHRQPPTLPSPSQPSISLDETRPRGDNDLLTEAEGREGGSSGWGLLELCVLWQSRDGGLVCVCVCVKGGETQGFKLGGGVYLYFGEASAVMLGCTEFHSFSKFQAWASAVNHNLFDVFLSCVAECLHYTSFTVLYCSIFRA